MPKVKRNVVGPHVTDQQLEMIKRLVRRHPDMKRGYGDVIPDWPELKVFIELEGLGLVEEYNSGHGPGLGGVGGRLTDRGMQLLGYSMDVWRGLNPPY
jgi:hypothetical protein